MNERKWTKGPWRQGTTSNSIGDTATAIMKSSGEVICEVDEYTDEDLANANLIAAAPDLYEALEDCAKFLKYDCEHTDSAKPELMRALAALAKARGEK